jgi:hypothetical protein
MRKYSKSGARRIHDALCREMERTPLESRYHAGYKQGLRKALWLLNFTIPEPIICEMCGTKRYVRGSGRPAKYCSAACRSKAYRTQKKAEAFA